MPFNQIYMRKKMVLSGICCLVAWSSTAIAAQDTLGNSNTLGTIWPQIESSFPGFAAKNAAIAVALQKERALRSSMLPQVKMQAQHSYGTFEGSSGGFFPQPGFFNVSGNAGLRGSELAVNNFGSATVEWDLITFGKQGKEKEAARTAVLRTETDKAAYLLDLKKLSSERYIALLYDESKWRWSAKNAQRLDDIRRITAGLSSAGLRPAADSLLAYSSYVQALGEQQRWTGAKEASLIKFLALFQGQSLDYQASLDRFLGLTAAKNGDVSQAITHHPFLENLAQASTYHQLEAEVHKRSSLPTVRLLGGYAYRSSGIGQDGMVSGAWSNGFKNSTNNVLAGVGLVWNLSSLQTNKYKAEASRQEGEAAKALHEQYRQSMEANLSAVHQEITMQFARLKNSKLAVQHAQDAYQMYLARYKSGLIALSELLQISKLLEEAEQKHIAAAKSYWILLAEEASLNSNFDFVFNNL